MTSCIDRKLNMGELRKEFERIYPTVEMIHMNVIAEVMLRTNFKKVRATTGIYYDFYQLKHIENGCNAILNKEE